jgi:Tol biopolymer transport system component/predicted Ser/Thr protein kinase
MTPERWQTVKEVLESALERTPEERSVFLERACAGDEELRKEVESLIASHEKTGNFIDVPPFEAAAQLLAEEKPELTHGHRFGHYKILYLLGAGGMGEVYLAQDEKLGRQIALKLLPALFTRDEDRLRRFEQEARAASALNHPNVCVIHEVGETAEGRDYIAMEYIDGVTLRQHITEARLKLSEVLDVAVQVASGLGAAHEVGVMHRDVKPENIMLRRDGYVKVLDFGLAKLTEQPTTDVTAPAGARAKTDTGVVMGTSSYMSPEQARGLGVDARTDIWSLGVVIYEMVTGEAPFKGETTSDVIVSILEREPAPLAQLLPKAPAELQRIITKTLHKDREGRYETAKDLLIDLKSLKQDSDLEAKLEHSQQPGLGGRGRFRTSAIVPAARSQPRWWANRFIWLSVAVILVVGVAVKFYSSRLSSERLTRSRSESSLSPMKVVPFTSFAGYESSPAFSPDGNQIAFAWDGATSDNIDIYVKLIDVGTPLRLTSNPSIDSSPTWSPDGRYIAFSRFSESEKGIFIVPALGGTERKLYSPDWGFYAFGEVVWSPDGKFLAYLDRRSPQDHYGIWLLSVENLERHQLTWPGAQDFFDLVPAFSPDGQTLAFVRVSSSRVYDIYLVPIGGGEPRRVTFDNREIDGLVWTPDGREIVFPSDRGGGYALWRISVTGGTPERLAVGGNNDFSPPLSPQGNRLSMSRQGNRLAYVRSAFDTNIWRIEIPKSKSRSNPPTKLIASTNLDQGPQYSPDGRKIVFESTRSGSYEIWVCDSNGTNLLQLTSFDRTTGTPRWSPDGRHIAFDARMETNSDIYITGAEGGSPRRITTETSEDAIPSWSRDGRWIYFASNRTGDHQVWKVPAEGGEAVQVTKQGGFASFVSPDGKFVYYAKIDRPGLWRIGVEGGEETPVLDYPELGYWGWWAVVNEGIYFINVEMKQHPVIEFFSFSTGRVRQIAKMEKEAVIAGPGLAISPDGQSILCAQVDQNGGDIILVENFR